MLQQNTSLAFNPTGQKAGNFSDTSHLAKLYYIAALLTTNAFGVLGNIILLLAIAFHPPLRRSSSCALIVHCIAIDLYASAITAPLLTIPDYLGPSYPLPKNFCKFLPLTVFIAYGANMYAYLVLAIHRFVATVFPRRFPILAKKSAILSFILLTWVANLIMNLFPVLEIGSKFVRNPRSGACSLVPVDSNLNGIILTKAFGYYIPTCLTGVCYIVVIGKTMIELKRRTGNRVLRRRLEIARMLFLSYVWQCVAVYPITIVTAYFIHDFQHNLTLQLTMKWLGNSFSSINPIFFVVSSKLFQDGVAKVIGYGCRKKHTGKIGTGSQIQATSNSRSVTNGQGSPPSAVNY